MVGGKQPKLVQLRFVRWRWSGEAVRARLGPARAHLVVEKGWQWNERLLLVGTMDGGGGRARGSHGLGAAGLATGGTYEVGDGLGGLGHRRRCLLSSAYTFHESRGLVRRGRRDLDVEGPHDGLIS